MTAEHLSEHVNGDTYVPFDPLSLCSRGRLYLEL
jgi:hypothetical protein